MKPIYLHLTGAIALSFTLAACIPSVPEEAPPPVSQPLPAPTPTPAPPPPVPQYENYLDAPQTPGDWNYGREEVGQTRRLYTFATFDTPKGETLLRLTCSPGGNFLIGRSVDGITTSQMVIKTETATKSFVAPPDPEGRKLKTAVVDPRDPILDAMAITKGRFAIEMEGYPSIYVPAWPEVSRVIEDCR